MTRAEARVSRRILKTFAAHGVYGTMGSAVATQLSVTLSNLFGDKNLDAAEKKALMFTDSVQDAAHRAGFVQARSHSLTLRTALRGALGDGELDLDELSQAVISRAGNDPMLRYQLLPPDIVDRDEFVAFWQPDAHPNSRRAAENKAKRRLRFDVDLEFGLQSRTGRTLELTGSVAAEVYLGAPHRAPILGRRALERADPAQLSADRGVRRGAGTLGARHRRTVRTRGGIHHDWLRPYVEKNANRYHVWGGRPRGQGMPAFPKGRPAPAFPALKSGTGTLPEGFDPITAPSSWYARWTSRCLDVSPQDGTFLAKALFAELAEQMLLSTLTTETGSTVYGLAPATVQVSAPTVEALLDNAASAGLRRLSDARAGQHHHRRRTRRCTLHPDPLPGPVAPNSQGRQLLPAALRLDRDETRRRARAHEPAADQDPARLRDRVQTRRHRPAGTQRARRNAHAGDGHRHR